MTRIEYHPRPWYLSAVDTDGEHGLQTIDSPAAALTAAEATVSLLGQPVLVRDSLGQLVTVCHPVEG